MSRKTPPASYDNDVEKYSGGEVSSIAKGKSALPYKHAIGSAAIIAALLFAGSTFKRHK